jgi:hypothetical protein
VGYLTTNKSGDAASLFIQSYLSLYFVISGLLFFGSFGFAGLVRMSSPKPNEHNPYKRECFFSEPGLNQVFPVVLIVTEPVK